MDDRIIEREKIKEDKLPCANEFTGPNGKDISFNTQVMQAGSKSFSIQAPYLLQLLKM